MSYKSVIGQKKKKTVIMKGCKNSEESKSFNCTFVIVRYSVTSCSDDNILYNSGPDKLLLVKKIIKSSFAWTHSMVSISDLSMIVSSSVVSKLELDVGTEFIVALKYSQG